MMHFLSLKVGTLRGEGHREFGISRKTGYKILNRYKDFGLVDLQDRSSRPLRYANQLPFQVEKAIVQLKQDHPTWGAPKIREKLIRKFPMIKQPATSTVHAVLDRNGLIKRRKRRRCKAKGTELSDVRTPNGLWCADYKGQFLLGNRKYCYPLTITDYHSRYLLACKGLESTKETGAFPVFERVFKEFGVPAGIRTDNGIPFAAPHSLFGLSRLSIWWCHYTKITLGLILLRLHANCYICSTSIRGGPNQITYDDSLHPRRTPARVNSGTSTKPVSTYRAQQFPHISTTSTGRTP